MSFAARSLADALPYPAAIADDDGRVLVANERWRHASPRPDCPAHGNLPDLVRDAGAGSDVVRPCRCDPGAAATVRVTGLESTCGAQRRLITVESATAGSSRDRLLGLLGPEIRTPAAAVTAAIELLRAQALPAAAQETIDDIQRTAQGLESLADDLAALARLETGEPVAPEGPVVLRQVLEGAAESMGAECRERGVLLLATPAPGLPAVVGGDAAVLRRILTSVVGHALRQPGTGEVVVTAEVDGPDAYRIDVTATGEPQGGSGFAPESAELALVDRLAGALGGATGAGHGSRALRHDAFPAHGTSAAQETASAGGGTTVVTEAGGGFRWSVRLPLHAFADRDVPVTAPPVQGRVAVAAPTSRSWLALSWLVTAAGAEPVRVGPGQDSDEQWAGLVVRCEESPAAGGTVTIGSTGSPGRGGTLTAPVTLDRLAAELRRHQAGPRTTPVTLEPLPPGRVLLAEDDDVNRTVLQRMISVLGVECDTVADGRAAVTALLGETRYHLALLDMKMPGMGGPEATREARAAGCTVPILALTATTLAEDQARCLDAGMNGHLGKPITLPELRHALEPYLTEPPPAAEPESPPAAAVPDVLSRAQLLELEAQLEGRELVAMTVNMFLAELDGRREAMATALATGGNDRLAAVAHTLKSSSALLGAQPLADACARVERLAATPVDAAILAAAVSEVDHAAAAAAIAMAAYLDES
ncbi:hybrid sensor histidine kinase/response regulator [Actinoplanes philippinensis]|uniref:histidine kinase n=1 Tax=Actinoplanes philippinensis TaxID=35752 RepID=A0A1I1ZM56_9ACTN|nr:hybrid sensor histidine kinase/response regulator [Actinoplanes philippinensis]GIE75455.1 hybrid sensor histidine kinase/response regulator [Actinoplanes philippinensis]SFE31663.1 two-component system, NarL family, capsular synthesis sensor histidine kinase RcsC [Actinoplanes philippinensis]